MGRKRLYLFVFLLLLLLLPALVAYGGGTRVLKKQLKECNDAKAGLETEKSQLQSENERLKSEVSQLQSKQKDQEARISQLEKQIADYEYLISKWRAELEAYGIETEEPSVISRTVEETLQQKEARIVELEADVEQMSQELEQARQELEQAKREAEQSKREAESLRQQLEQAKREAEVQQIQRELEQTRRELTQAKRDLEQAKRESDQAKRDLEQAKRESDQAKRELEQTKRELDQTKRALEQTKRELDQTKSALAQKTAELEAVQKRLEQVTMQLDKSERELEQMRIASSLNEKKIEELKAENQELLAALKAYEGIQERTREMTDIALERLRILLRSEIEAGQVRVFKGALGITLDIVGEHMFNTGSVEINPLGKTVLGKIAPLFEGLDGYFIGVIGNADARPIVTPALKKKYPTNWELSSARGTAVIRYLLSKARIEPDRLVAMGLGEYQPIDTSKTEEGYGNNRRVNIILLPIDAVAAIAVGAEIK